jgi:ketosteroid isomerase-like protein
MVEDVVIQEILVVNDRFYRALSQADLAVMTEVWHHGPATECVHPGWERLQGWTVIEQSWALIFQNQGPLPVQATSPLVHRRGEMAWVTCYENISSESEGTLQISQMLATNVFEQIEGRWQMVIHHASPAPPGVIRPRTWRASLN